MSMEKSLVIVLARYTGFIITSSITYIPCFLQSADPEELTIEVVLEAESVSEVESEVEVSEVSEAPPEEDIIVESTMSGPMHK